MSIFCAFFFLVFFRNCVNLILGSAVGKECRKGVNYMELKNILKEILRTSVENSEVAGANFLVLKDGEEMVYVQAGMADREAGREIKRDTIFRLYSQTKPVTSVAAMILMERGLLDFYAPVSEFLPSFAQMYVAKTGERIPCTRQILINDLLNMTSGLVYPDEGTEAGRAADKVFQEACSRLHSENPMTTRELADRLATRPLAFEPGSSWAYGTSADILGAVIEVVSGKRLSEFMSEEIFEPLGMKDTAFWVPKEKQDRFAKAYETVEKENGGKELILYTGDNLAICNDMAKPPAYEAGGAGLASTLDDYSRFAAMLLNGGSLNGVQILQPKTVEFFKNGELLPVQQDSFRNWVGLEGYSYGNLMRVCKNPSQSGMMARKGEYGWDGWLGMYFANFPEENMTILMGTQKRNGGTFGLTRKLRNVVLSRV